MTERKFIRIDRFSFRYQYYAYVDHEDYSLDSLFISEKIEVRFCGEYAKKDMPWRIVTVKVRKTETERFEKAFEKAENVMLLKGYTGYAEACEILKNF